MSERYNISDKVTVNKDIYRIDHNTRNKCLYGSPGEIGTIIEIFRPQSTAGGGYVKTPFYAKVKMDVYDGIKTFRLTSLSRVV
jgi:hypothetical protein